MIPLLLLLFAPIPGACAASLLAFTIGDSVSLTVESQTGNQLMWNIQMLFQYAGTPDVSTVVKLYDSTCSNELPLVDPTIAASDPAVIVDSNGGFVLSLLVDAAMAQQDASLWTQQDGSPNAQLAFCSRVELYYESTMVNFATTAVSIDVVAAGGFVSFEDETSVQTATTQTATAQASISYQASIYSCDVDANEIDQPGPTLPGSVVRFCVSLSDSAADSGAYVESVEDLSYRSTDSALETVDVVGGGVALNALALTDCTQHDGVCRVEFIPSAAYFLDGTSLLCSGNVVVAFGSDNDTATRLLAKTGTPEQKGMRQLSKAAEFSFQIELGGPPDASQGGDATKGSTLDSPTHLKGQDARSETEASLSSAGFSLGADTSTSFLVLFLLGILFKW